MDCGPSCLKIISKYFGKDFSLEYLRQLCNTSRSGSSLLSISAAAEKLGFRTVGAKIEFEDMQTEDLFPCIAYWRQKHFIIVYKIKKNTVYVSDPAYGLISYPKEEFMKNWSTDGKTGIVMAIEPTADFFDIEEDEQKQPSKRGMKVLLKYLIPYKKLLFQVFLGLIAGSVLQLIIPFLTQSIVDIGIKQNDLNFINLILIAQLVLFIGRTSIEFMRAHILLHVSSRINIKLISDFFIKLMKLPLGFFDTKLTGDILQRIADHQRIETFITTGSLNTLFSCINILVFGGVLAYYNVMIFLVFLFGSALYFVWISVFMKKRAELDILMLTQGYRRFSYKEIMANRFPANTYLPEQGMSITGILRDRTGMPVRKGALRLTSPGRTLSSETLTTNSGLFAFPNLVFEDGAELLINAKYNAAGSNMMIVLDNPPFPEVTSNPYPATEVLNIDSTLSAYLDNSKKQYSNLRTLKEVKITGATVKKPSHADHTALTGLSMMPDHLIDGERLSGCNDLLTCLKSMAMGLTFDTDRFFVTRDYMQGNKSTPVQVFINGNAVDAINLGSIQPADVESIEIFLKDQLGLVFKNYNCNGVLVVNTKKIPKSNMSLADLKKMMPQSNMLKITPKGYTKVREFYAPKYVTQTSSYTGNDLRTTIYWNPKIVTNATGDTVLEFYNADGKGTYRAVIEGVDANGNVGRSVYRYTVK